MRTPNRIIAVFFASLVLPIASQAEPFNPKCVPADAKWVIHADLDTARDTKTYEFVKDRVLADNNTQAKFDQLEQITGMKIPDDLQNVTLYGKSAGDDAGVVIAHGHINRAKTQNNLRMAQQFGTSKFHDYDLMTWFDTDKNQTMFGAFHDDTTVVLGHKEQQIQDTLDAMDGKVESLKPESSLAAGFKPQVLVYVAARDMSQLHGQGDKPNPLVSSIDSAWLSISENDKVFTLHAELQATSSDTAEDLQSSIAGIKGMLRLAAGGDNPDPVATAAVAASKSFAISSKDKTVVVDWPLQIEQAASLFKAFADRQAAKN